MQLFPNQKKNLMIPNLSSLPQSVPLKYLFTLSISTLYNLYHVLYTVQRCMYPIYHLYSVHCIVYLFTQLTTCTVYCTQFSRGPTVQLVQYCFVHALKSVECIVQLFQFLSKTKPKPKLNLPVHVLQYTVKTLYSVNMYAVPFTLKI